MLSAATRRSSPPPKNNQRCKDPEPLVPLPAQQKEIWTAVEGLTICVRDRREQHRKQECSRKLWPHGRTSSLCPCQHPSERQAEYGHQGMDQRGEYQPE